MHPDARTLPQAPTPPPPPPNTLRYATVKQLCAAYAYQMPQLFHDCVGEEPVDDPNSNHLGSLCGGSAKYEPFVLSPCADPYMLQDESKDYFKRVVEATANHADAVRSYVDSRVWGPNVQAQESVFIQLSIAPSGKTVCDPADGFEDSLIDACDADEPETDCSSWVPRRSRLAGTRLQVLSELERTTVLRLRLIRRREERQDVLRSHLVERQLRLPRC